MTIHKQYLLFFLLFNKLSIGLEKDDKATQKTIDSCDVYVSSVIICTKELERNYFKDTRTEEKIVHNLTRYQRCLESSVLVYQAQARKNSQQPK